MKNKKLMCIIVCIIFLSIGILTYLLNDSKKHIIYDGVILAITVDGKNYDSLPGDSNKYTAAIECDDENVIGKYQPVKVLTADGSATSNYEMKLSFSNVPPTGAMCSISFTTLTSADFEDDLLKTKVESINTTYNDGYRYVGKDPDNWIWFNDEMWRIIGSVPVCTYKADNTTSGACAEADADRPRLVKIIRADSIGDLAFHSASRSNVWGNGNALYTLLNSTYWGKGKIIGESPCCITQGYGKCNYNAIGISPDDYYGQMVEEVFMNVGASSTSAMINAAYASEIGTVSKATRIGLMNASDYGYAADLVAANKTYSEIGLYSLRSYEQYNWLFGAGTTEWIMTPYGVQSGRVYSDGSIDTNDTSVAATVRPSLYLNENVYVISGNGSATNPYIVGSSNFVTVGINLSNQGVVIPEETSKTIEKGGTAEFSFSINDEEAFANAVITCDTDVTTSKNGNKITVSNVTSNTTCAIDFPSCEYTLLFSGNGYYDDDVCGTCEGTYWSIDGDSLCEFDDGGYATCGGSGELYDAGNWETYGKVCN